MNAKLIDELKKKGYSVNCFDKAIEAASYIDSELDNVSIGMGSSVTIEQLNLYNILKTHNKVIWHSVIPEGKTDQELRIEERYTDVYISSVNGIAETGEIVNIDNKSNRVAEIAFGHKKVILVIGCNKIAENLESAIYRARNIAAPLNAQRLKRKTPCAINADKCYNCSSPDRICRTVSLMLTKPAGCEYEIILINEELGF